MFGQALTEIIRRLDDAKKSGLVQQYVLIGGFAVSVWGVPRATNDFALVLGTSGPNALAKLLQAEFQCADFDDPLRGVFRLHLVVEGNRVPVQLILLPPIWENLVFQDIVCLTIFELAVPVVTWQPLILLKLYAGGPQDLLDAKEILAVQKPNPTELKK